MGDDGPGSDITGGNLVDVYALYDSWETTFLTDLRIAFEHDQRIARADGRTDGDAFCVQRLAIIDTILLGREASLSRKS